MFGAALLGGPLTAGYIIAQNFKALGNQYKYSITWLITLMFTIGLFIAIVLAPDSLKIPIYLIPIIYSVLAFAIMKLYQGKTIKQHMASGGQTHSLNRIYLVGFVGLIISLAIFLPLTFALMPKANFVVYYQPFNKINHEISYNAQHIDEDEIIFLGEQLKQINYFDSTDVMYLYVDKINDALKISIPFVDPAWEDPEAIKYFENIHTRLKESYSSNNYIEMLMCDTVLNVHRRLK